MVISVHDLWKLEDASLEWVFRFLLGQGDVGVFVEEVVQLCVLWAEAADTNGGWSIEGTLNVQGSSLVLLEAFLDDEVLRFDTEINEFLFILFGSGCSHR